MDFITQRLLEHYQVERFEVYQQIGYLKLMYNISRETGDYMNVELLAEKMHELSNTISLLDDNIFSLTRYETEVYLLGHMYFTYRLYGGYHQHEYYNAKKGKWRSGYNNWRIN